MTDKKNSLFITITYPDRKDKTVFRQDKDMENFIPFLGRIFGTSRQKPLNLPLFERFLP
jgi:hypothetical protein